MKITLSKSQWQQIGKTAGWIFMFCSWCGKPLDNKNGVGDHFCEDKKCKMHDQSTPDKYRAISDGICSQCNEDRMFTKNKEEFPANINKGKTPRDALLRDIKEQEYKEKGEIPSDEELNRIFNKNITSALKLMLYKK